MATFSERLWFLVRAFGRRPSRIVFLAYLVAITVGTHWPSLSVPNEMNCDKFIHGAAYFGLSVLLWYAYPRSWGSPSGRLGILVCCLAGYASIDELTQMAVPGRTASFADWGADLLGIGLGLCIMYFFVSRGVKVRFPRGELAK